MNVSCPNCRTVYRVDPVRVPAGGVVTRCSRCAATFPISRPQDGAAPAAPANVLAPEARSAAAARREPEPASPAGGPTGEPEAQPGAAGPRPVFGTQDPAMRAQRLARALVSDIIAYNREKYERARTAGTLRADFREEILKSWEEYVQQVGPELAKGTPYFSEALNDVLAGGTQVF